MRMTSATERDIYKIALALGDSVKVRTCVVVAVDKDVATIIYGRASRETAAAFTLDVTLIWEHAQTLITTRTSERATSPW